MRFEFLDCAAPGVSASQTENRNANSARPQRALFRETKVLRRLIFIGAMK
jgi:hypothetical protein